MFNNGLFNTIYIQIMLKGYLFPSKLTMRPYKQLDEDSQ